jgi:hypothetical protein
MSLVHRPTLIRTMVLSASLTLILYAALTLLAPTLIGLAGAGAARATSLVGGFAVRLLAGRVAARPAWAAGADGPLVATSVLLGGFSGWLLFPGLVSFIGLAVGANPAGDLAGLLVDVVAWQVCLVVGALSARWGRAKVSTGTERGRRWASRPRPSRSARS